MSSPRCSLCDYFESEYLCPRAEYQFSCSFAALEDSVKVGCPRSTSIHNGIAIIESKFCDFEDIMIAGVNPTDHSFRVELYGRRRISLDFTAGIIPRHTASAESFSWVSDRLNTCRKDHGKCNRPTASKLPTRILDVGPLDGSPGNQVKLVEPFSISAQYACLSHCWGVVEVITTTRKNLAAHCQKIPWKGLSKTFQDAVTYTRLIGLRYLWIDSLCILQDDKEDWRRESAQMAAIYQNSYITLAATKSPDGNGGFFSEGSIFDHNHPLEPRLQVPLSVPLIGTEYSTMQYYVRRRIVHFDSSYKAADGFQTANPLMTRAWAYQERLLSPRVLHFCKQELVWECQEITLCECRSFDPDIHPKQMYSTTIGTWTNRRAHLNLTVDDSQNKSQHSSEESATLLKLPHGNGTGLIQPKLTSKTLNCRPQVNSQSTPFANSVERVIPNIVSTWHRLVEEYSSLRLSKRSDKLPAIAGLAKQIGALKTGTYLAGLWEDSIYEDLLWISRPERISHKEVAYPRPTAYRAPTWSWASTSSGVIFVNSNGLRDFTFPTFRVLQSRCAPVRDGDWYGEVASGSLVIKGTLQPAIVVYIDPSRYFLHVKGKQYTVVPDYFWSPEGRAPVRDGEIVYCLGLFKHPRFAGSYFSLVVRQLADDSGQYERIGAAKFHEGSAGDLFDEIVEETITLV
ncbi:HET-domain-containing protein [Lophium mytilinum]|uniref:HET-domain-containing protein n=1 Tax=Lophium mytilinum TaxID=390894 RepID=A0A6A6QCS5_9PEZI|nr:HET-domain-containing protein [Lophium mytilinum]